MSEAYVEGKVDVETRELSKLLKEHNELIKHQNNILLNISETLKKR